MTSTWARDGARIPRTVPSAMAILAMPGHGQDARGTAGRDACVTSEGPRLPLLSRVPSSRQQLDIHLISGAQACQRFKS